MRIAVDAMGGDSAPDEIVKGALEALERLDDVELLLAGLPEKVEPLLPARPREGLRFLPCSQTVDMQESPVEAVRRKKDSSLRRVIEMVARKEADAAVSAGNTGAMAAAASMLIKPLEGCRRPGIAVKLPTTSGHAVAIDVGANISPRPFHLLQYAVMAQVFAREVLGVARPRVGLLSVGEERGKGTDLVKAAHALMSEHLEDFAGNCEGRDIFSGVVDVVVCDGFTGNVLLKALEGYASYLVGSLMDNIAKSLPANHERLRSLVIEFVGRNDYREYGGAPLLGIEAPVIISHGSSNATAIANAIAVARDFSGHGVNSLIIRALRSIDAANHTGEA